MDKPEIKTGIRMKGLEFGIAVSTSLPSDMNPDHPLLDAAIRSAFKAQAEIAIQKIKEKQ